MLTTCLKKSAVRAALLLLAVTGFAPWLSAAEVATLYLDADYAGVSASFSEGSYDLDALYSAFSAVDASLTRDDVNDAVSSVKVQPGYVAVLFYDNSFSSDSLVIDSDMASLPESYNGRNWKDQASALRVRAQGLSGLGGKTYRFANGDAYNGSLLFMDIEDVSDADGYTHVVQYNDEGTNDSQRYSLTEVYEGSGIYYITNADGNANIFPLVTDPDYPTANFVALANGSTEASNCEFIVYSVGDGYYQLIHRASSLVVDYTAEGPTQRLYVVTNSSQTSQQWKLVPDGWPATTIYRDINYGALSLGLPEGEYNTEWLGIYGFEDNDLTSLKVCPGYKVTIYDEDNFSGNYVSYTSDVTYVGADWNDKMSSIKIEAEGVSGLGGTYVPYKIQNKLTGKFMDIENNGEVSSGTAHVVQNESEGTEAYQRFFLTETAAGSGIYNIRNAGTGKYWNIIHYASVNGQELVVSDRDADDIGQEFIAVELTDAESGNAYYQFVARYYAKPVEIPDGSTSNGEWLKLYDNSQEDRQQWALVSLKPDGYPVSTVYNDANYGSTTLELPEGEYNANDLEAYGFAPEILTSFTILDGYKITLYQGDNFTGTSTSYTGSVASLVGDGWNDKTVSLKVEPWGQAGLAGTYKLQNRNSGLFMDLKNWSTDNNAIAVQSSGYGNDFQRWTFTEVEGTNGVYSVANAASGKVLDIADANTANGGVVQVYDNYNSANQQFIVSPIEEDGVTYYQLIARHCGKPIEVPSSSTAVGTELKTYANNSTYTQQWVFTTLAQPTLTFASNNEAWGTVKATVNGVEVLSGKEIANGDAIELTATAASNYKVGSWTVDGSDYASSSKGLGITAGTESVDVLVNFSPDCTAPVAYEFSGDAMFCPSGGYSTLRLASSQSSCSYTLCRDGADIETVQGVNDALSWQVAVEGTYTVRATIIGKEDLCGSFDMKGSVAVSAFTSGATGLTATPSVDTDTYEYGVRSFTVSIPVEWSVSGDCGTVTINKSGTEYEAHFYNTGTATVTATMLAPNNGCSDTATFNVLSRQAEICND